MKPISIFFLWFTLVVGGGLLGLVTNAVNAQVSPLYFRTILHWESINEITGAIIAQGIFEGLICGLVLSTFFFGIVAFVSEGRCEYGLGLRYIAALLALSLLLWMAGGILAVTLAWLSPEFYRRTFIGVPDETSDMLRYAWVGGSIWGIQFGGAAATFILALAFSARWRRSHPANL